eukprot:733253_1
MSAQPENEPNNQNAGVGGVMSAPLLELSHRSVRNGLISITITNFEDLFPHYDDTVDSFYAQIAYRFFDPNSHYYYHHIHNNIKHARGPFQLMDQPLVVTNGYSHVYLKVPVFLYPYTVKFQLTLLDGNFVNRKVRDSGLYCVGIPPMCLQ